MAVLSMRDYDSQKKIVVFDVCEEIWIGKYVIQDTTYDTDGNPSNKQPHQVGFPQKKLKVGDQLELHLTEFGEPKLKPLFSGKARLVVYAGFQHAINKTGDTLVLLHKVDSFNLDEAPEA